MSTPTGLVIASASVARRLNKVPTAAEAGIYAARGVSTILGAQRQKKKEDLLSQRRKDAKSLLFLASSRLSEVNPSTLPLRAFVASCEKNRLTQSHEVTKEAGKDMVDG